MENTKKAIKEKLKWRGYVITLGGMMVHMTLGSMYTFGNLNPYLTSFLKYRTADTTIRNVDSIWIYALTVVGQGCGMLHGGFLERKLGPRIATLIGCWTMSIGVLTTAWAVQHSFLAVLATYGFINGLGIGIAYGIPIATAMKWNDSKRGITSGFVVSGFAAGAFIFNQAITAILNPSNISPTLEEANKERYFKEKAILDRVPSIFWILSSIYAVIQLIGVLLLKRPKKKKKEQIVTVSMKVSLAERRGYLEQKKKSTDRLEVPNANADRVRRVSEISTATSDGSYEELPATTVNINELRGKESQASSQRNSEDSDSDTDNEGVYNTVTSNVSTTTVLTDDSDDAGDAINRYYDNPSFVSDSNEKLPTISKLSAVDNSKEILPHDEPKKKKTVSIISEIDEKTEDKNEDQNDKKHKYNFKGSLEKENIEPGMRRMHARVHFDETSNQRRRPSTAERLVLEFRRLSRRLSVPEFVFRNIFKRSESRRERMLRPLKLFKTKTFYKLWFIFVLNGTGISFMLTLWKAYGQSFINDDYFLSLVGACSSLFNAIGRITWGIVADKFSFRVSMMCLSSVFAVFAITLNVTELVSKPLFFIWMCLINLGFAGNFALLPFASSRAVAHICVGAPGTVFSAMTVSGTIGAILTVELKDTIGWHGMFFLTGGMSIVVILIAYTFDAKTPAGERV